MKDDWTRVFQLMERLGAMNEGGWRGSRRIWQKQVKPWNALRSIWSRAGSIGTNDIYIKTANGWLARHCPGARVVLRHQVVISRYIRPRLFDLFYDMADDVIKIHNSDLHPSRKVSVRVFIYGGKDFRAHAVRENGVNLILFSTGLVLSIVSFCNSMVADGAFEGFGNPTKGKRQTDPRRFRASDIWLQSRSEEEPVSAADIQLATLFAQRMFFFVIRHELAHVALRHLEYLSSLGVAASIEERRGSIRAPTSPLAIQALEVAADACAFQWSYGQFFSTAVVDTSGHPPTKAAFDYFFSDQAKRIEHNLLAIFFLFALFDEPDWRPEDLIRATHFPAPMRLVGCLAVLTDLLKQQNNRALLKKFEKVAAAVPDRAVEIIGRTLQRRPNPSLYRSSYRTVADEHNQRVYDLQLRLPRELISLHPL